MSISEYIMLLTYFPVIAAMIGFLLLYRKLSKALQAFSWFIFLSGVIQLASLFFWYRHMNNMSLLHVYVAGGFVCLAWFYRFVLGEFIRPVIIWIAAGLFVLFCIINALFFQPILSFNSYALIAESVLVVILSLFTFLFLLTHTVREAGIPDMKSIAWINSGLFIYSLSCFLLYYSNKMTANYPLALRRLAWAFYDFFSIVMYTCFIIGLWKRSKIPN